MKEEKNIRGKEKGMRFDKLNLNEIEDTFSISVFVAQSVVWAWLIKELLS